MQLTHHIDWWRRSVVLFRTYLENFIILKGVWSIMILYRFQFCWFLATSNCISCCYVLEHYQIYICVVIHKLFFVLCWVKGHSVVSPSGFWLIISDNNLYKFLSLRDSSLWMKYLINLFDYNWKIWGNWSFFWYMYS